MFGQDLILRTKLIPPRTRRWTLARPRLDSRLDLAADFRLTILQAPTGYGKTTTLAAWLATAHAPFAWYALGTVETDPLILLLHLIYAFRTRFPTAGHAALELLQREHHLLTMSVLRPALHLLINDLCDLLTAETFLALDDFHLLEGRLESLSIIEELIEAAPPRLHLIIASRSHPGLSGLIRWQAKGYVLSIDKSDLAFLPTETHRLFCDYYRLPLSPEQAAHLTGETEGWVIALQMFWQSRQAQPSAGHELNLTELPGNLPGLFDYLAQEVLDHQTPAVQNFLLSTALLRRLQAESCATLLNTSIAECAHLLQTIYEAGLFLVPLGDGLSYRYHHLFGEFLAKRLAQLHPAVSLELHRRAATFYATHDRPEDALTHHLAAQDFPAALDLLRSGLAAQLLSTGRLERLEDWLKSFPPPFLENQPTLLCWQGDCYRLTSRFEKALSSYLLAAEHPLNDRLGWARALRGAALVYIDTVQPAQAEQLLEQALALVNHHENHVLQAALLRDLAENKINRGRPLEAEGLFRQARHLLNRPESTYEDEDVRILLRTGRLAEASEILQQNLSAEQTGAIARAGRNHREALLVLSLIDSLRGDGSSAIDRARQGIKLAQELHTPFTEAVAWQRLGHAFTVSGSHAEAHEAFRTGLAWSDRLQVRRLSAEGYMGLCALEGRPTGDLSAARHTARQGLAIARQAGDEWIEGFIQLTLAAALVQHGPAYYDEARPTLETARQLLAACGDRLGLTLSNLWSCLLDPTPTRLADLYRECDHNGYLFLLSQPTLFGPKDPATLALLQPAPTLPVAATVTRSAPTCLLTITALGGFVVRRSDGREISNRDWQREKARRLLQLLLTLRDQPLPREQITDLLWPDSDPVSADAGFKVVLNALTNALEPDRPNRSQSSFIQKVGRGSQLAYSLDLSAVWFDVSRFDSLIRHARQLETAQSPFPTPAALDLYRQALDLYQGEYLPACLYDDWAAPERERLLDLFLTTAERVAQTMLQQGEWEHCLALCRQILSRDNCWEEAYRLTMLAYARQGNRTALLRTYERCTQTLSDELGLAPMEQTLALYQELLSD